MATYKFLYRGLRLPSSWPPPFGPRLTDTSSPSQRRMLTQSIRDEIANTINAQHNSFLTVPPSTSAPPPPIDIIFQRIPNDVQPYSALNPFSPAPEWLVDHLPSHPNYNCTDKTRPHSQSNHPPRPIQKPYTYPGPSFQAGASSTIRPSDLAPHRTRPLHRRVADLRRTIPSYMMPQHHPSFPHQPVARPQPTQRPRPACEIVVTVTPSSASTYKSTFTPQEAATIAYGAWKEAFRDWTPAPVVAINVTMHTPPGASSPSSGAHVVQQLNVLIPARCACGETKTQRMSRLHREALELEDETMIHLVQTEVEKVLLKGKIKWHRVRCGEHSTSARWKRRLVRWLPGKYYSGRTKMYRWDPQHPGLHGVKGKHALPGKTRVRVR